MSAGMRTVVRVAVLAAISLLVAASIVLLERGDGGGGNWTIEDARGVR